MRVAKTHHRQTSPRVRQLNRFRKKTPTSLPRSSMVSVFLCLNSLNTTSSSYVKVPKVLCQSQCGQIPTKSLYLLQLFTKLSRSPQLGQREKKSPCSLSGLHCQRLRDHSRQKMVNLQLKKNLRGQQQNLYHQWPKTRPDGSSDQRSPKKSMSSSSPKKLVLSPKFSNLKLSALSEPSIWVCKQFVNFQLSISSTETCSWQTKKRDHHSSQRVFCPRPL